VEVDVGRPGLGIAVFVEAGGTGSLEVGEATTGVEVLVFTRVGTVCPKGAASELAQAMCLLPIKTIEASRNTSRLNFNQDRRIILSPVGLVGYNDKFLWAGKSTTDF